MFDADIVKFGLVLTHFSLFGRGQTGGKKIFLGENAPMPTCGTATELSMLSVQYFAEIYHRGCKKIHV